MKARLGRDLDADPVDAGQLTLECLRYMYRMLFVLFIESRPELGYAPIKAQSYYSGYSLESLRDIADNIRDDVNEVGDGYYLHETLAKLYELIYDGYPKTEDELKKATGSDSLHDMFLIAPLKAHIFDPEYTKMITAAKLRNSCMKDWNKKFTSPFTDDEVVTLLRLSAVIDELWEAQIQLRKEVGSKTQDALSIFGYTDDAEDSHTTIRQKDKIFSELYKSEHMKNAGPYARLKFAMDYWCALWFWPIDKADLLPTRSEFLFDMSLILEGTMASVNVTDSVKGGQLSLFPTEMEQMAMDIIDTYGTDTIVDIPRLRKENPRLDLAARIAEQNKFMHWELEFADLFTERGGFDLIIGNPPWIKIEWKGTYGFVRTPR